MKLSRTSALARHPLLVAIFWGLAAALCVPPLPLGPLAPFFLAGPLLSLRPLRGWAAARFGFVWGIAFHLATLLWIRNVMAVGPILAIGAGVILLMVYLSLFPALWAFGWTRLRDRGLWWMWPGLFAAIEVLRTFGQMSFPWSHVGYDFGSWPILLQGTSIVGVLGLGFLIAATAAVLAAPATTTRGRLRLGVVGLWVLWLGFGAWRLAIEERGPSFRVAVVQPSIPQTRKWEESYFRSVMDKTYGTMSKLRDSVDLVVLPETAIPDFWSLRPWEVSRMRSYSDSLGVDLVLGALDFDRDSAAPNGAWIRNSAFLLQPREAPQRYDKIRLVPFSERLPFDDVFPVLNYVDLGEGDFAAGDSLPVFRTRGVAWAPTICYELVYPDFARLAASRGATVLVDITNDGWFGRSMGPWQHWNIERVRAVESGLPLVRSANTGISGVVDSRGRLLAVSSLMADTVLVATVHAGEASLAARVGGWIEGILGSMGILALIAFAAPGFAARRV